MMYRSIFRSFVPLVILVSIMYSLFSGCQQEEPAISIGDPAPLTTSNLSVVVMPDTVPIPPPPDTVVTPPAGLLVDSMIGTFYGTCYHYKRDYQNNEWVYTYDTTYNSPITVSRVDANYISATGCGTQNSLYGYFLSAGELGDSTVSESYFISSYHYTMDIDFRIRRVFAFSSKSPGNGFFESWKSVWYF